MGNKERIYTDEQKEKNKEYYIKNREIILKKVKVYNLKNKEKLKSYKHEYYIKNKEKHLLNCEKWKKENEDKVRKYKRKWYHNNSKNVIDTARELRNNNKNVRNKANIRNYSNRNGFKNNIIKKRGSRCEMCGITTKYIDLHHKEYKNKEDCVLLLCKKCHGKIHRKSI